MASHTVEMIRNALMSRALMAALQWLRQAPEPRAIMRLIRAGSVADAVALAHGLILEFDRP